jgi:hypothetical protein
MNRAVLLSWTDVNTTESGYEVERRDDSVPSNPFINVGNVPTNSTSFTDNVVAPRAYSWRVRAVRFSEFGPYSNIVSLEVTEPLLVITDLTAVEQ